MVERMTAWECVGCGRIEGQRPCIGICSDRKAEFVYSADFDRLSNERDRLAQRVEVLTDLVRRLAHVTPRPGEWEASYRAIQEQAKAALGVRPAVVA